MTLDAFVVMPNHLHGVILIERRGMARHAPTNPDERHDPIEHTFSHPIAGSLPVIVGAFKAAVSKRIHRLPHPSEHPLWQRGYHDHIIRDEGDLNRIQEYILNNPARWAEDRFYGG